MRKTADVVIIGGGAIGTSILYHLTSLGLRDVVLLEKGGLCSGSSGDSAAIVRQHYSNEVGIHLVKKSVEIFQRFPEEFDGVSVFNAIGWLFLCPPEASEVFDTNLDRLKRLGVQTSELSIEEAIEELPGLNPEGIGRVAFEPDSGHADPHGTATAFVAKARANGAEAHMNTPATSIKIEKSRISAVVTPLGEISTPTVVNAAGPWAKEIGRWVGLDLPLEISREQDMVIRPPADAPPLRHSVSNMVDRVYFRPEAAGTILVGTGHPKENEPADPNGYSHTVSGSFVQDATRRFVHRFPSLSGSEFLRGWAGLYAITPDWNMIVDRAPGVAGMYLAVGGSGHSFKLAPAIGLCLAEVIVHGEARTVDISPLRAARFGEGAILRSTYGGNRA